MTRTQIGVAVGMAAAFLVTVALFALGPELAPDLVTQPTLGQRLLLAAMADIPPLLSLTAAIAWVANARFFSPDDIDGAGLTPEGPALRVPRAVLANTAEQALLALPLYSGLALTLPASQLALPLLLGGAFLIGRGLFAIGYARGAAARSVGFALTFYPSVGALIVLVMRLAPIAA
jgi:hypothetical protein